MAEEQPTKGGALGIATPFSTPPTSPPTSPRQTNTLSVEEEAAAVDLKGLPTHAPGHLLTQVLFRVCVGDEGELPADAEVVVVGGSHLLGGWDVQAGVVLEKDLGDNGVWHGTVSTTRDEVIEYKYLIRTPDRVLSIESLEKPRSLLPVGVAVKLNDGKYGTPPGNTTKRKWVDQGWLIHDYELRLTLIDLAVHAVSETDTHALVPKVRLVGPLSLVHPEPTRYPADGPVKVFMLYARSPDLLAFRLDVFHPGAEDTVLGTTVVTAVELRGLRGILRRPLLDASMAVVGHVDLGFLVTSPFAHVSNNPSVIQRVQPSDTALDIGHRGTGSNKNPLQRGTFLRENTLDSFVAAAKLGVSYVETDVQVTADGVPVIFHDFRIIVHSHTPNVNNVLRRVNYDMTRSGDLGGDKDVSLNVKVGISSLTLQQFKSLKPDLMSSSGVSKQPPRASAGTDGSPSKGEPVQRPVSGDPADAPGSPTKKVKKQSRLKRASSSDALPTLAERQRLTSFNDSSSDLSTVEQEAFFITGSFDTLSEVLTKVQEEEPDLGFNLELKYPVTREDHAELNPAERNEWLDTVLQVVFSCTAPEFRVIFSSFDPDLCAMCRMKQPRYPVFFLTDGGELTYEDERMNSVEAAIDFALSARLHGIVSEAIPIVKDLGLVETVHATGLLLFTFGDLNNDPESVAAQQEAGVDAIITDSVYSVARRKIITPSPQLTPLAPNLVPFGLPSAPSASASASSS